MADQQEKRISCVVCEQPLSPKRHESEKDPGYFPSSSTGYEAGDEPDRNCEDISKLLTHLSTLHSAIWSTIRHMNLIDKVNQWAADTLDERESYIEEACSLSFLFMDIQNEMKRRAAQLRTWLQNEEEHEKGGVMTRTHLKPLSTAPSPEPPVLRAQAFEKVGDA